MPLIFLSFYLFTSLIGMGPMNIGFGLVFFSLLPLLIGKPTQALTSIKNTPETKAYAKAAGIMALACILSLVMMHFYPYAYAGHVSKLSAHAFLKLWHLLIPFFLIVAFHQGKKEPESSFHFLLRVWWGTTLALLLVAVIQFNTGWPLPQVIPTNPNHFHAILFLGHHLSVSSILIFPCFTALAVALGAYVRTQRLLKFEAAAGTAGLIILFLCYARTAWLAIPIGIILLFARSFKPRTFLAGVFALFALIAIGAQTPAMKERIHNSMGIQDRFRLWEAAIDYFKHRPITGIGWLATNEYAQYYFMEKDPLHYKDYFWGHSHNNFFEMLGGAGILGLLTYIIFISFTFRFAWRTSKIASSQGLHYYSDFSWGVFIALILLHFNGLTNVTFWEGKVIHQQMISLGLLFMIRILVRRKSERHHTSVL